MKRNLAIVFLLTACLGLAFGFQNCSSKSGGGSGGGGLITDSDGDGITNANDNCPNVANATQSNIDGDSTGDSCDTDYLAQVLNAIWD